MSFREAEDSDATLQGIADVLRAALAEADYGRNPHQVYDNMDVDPLIYTLSAEGNPASRLDLLLHIRALQDTPTSIPSEVVSFCRQHLRRGPQLEDSGGRSFGRVQSLDSLVNALVDPIANPSTELTRGDAEILVWDLMAITAGTDIKLEKQKATLGGKQLSKYQMWCYQPEDAQEPFREIGESRGQAVNVLGLGFAYDEPEMELVRWAHALPVELRAHQPTAWDAGATKGNVHWRPGGRTYQLETNEYGVPEVVHPPIQGKHLIAPIEALP